MTTWYPMMTGVNSLIKFLMKPSPTPNTQLQWHLQCLGRPSSLSMTSQTSHSPLEWSMPCLHDHSQSRPSSMMRLILDEHQVHLIPSMPSIDHTLRRSWWSSHLHWSHSPQSGLEWVLSVGTGSSGWLKWSPWPTIWSCGCGLSEQVDDWRLGWRGLMAWVMKDRR